MNDHVLAHVVSFVNCRRVREALGFDMDRCIRWNIPPCRLSPDALFETRLHLRQVSVSTPHTRDVYYRDSNVLVSMSFDCDWGIMKLLKRTEVTVTIRQQEAHPPKNYYIFGYGPNSIQRAYYINRFPVSCISLAPVRSGHAPRSYLLDCETNLVIFK